MTQTQSKNSFEVVKKWQIEIGNAKVKYRKSSYGGKGRPKKDDYIVLPLKDLRDYQVMEIYENGFSTNYVPKTK